MTPWHDEDGHPLPDTSHIALEHVPVEEDDAEPAGEFFGGALDGASFTPCGPDCCEGGVCRE